MWVNREVDIPVKLIAAATTGRLVLFVGAGASVDPPSNLPMFPDLAAQIAGGVWHQRPNETIDSFIGRMESNVVAQGIARRIIGNPASQPCELHRQIVRLFDSLPRLRIV